MYHGAATITIEPVANGWIVIMPHQARIPLNGIPGSPQFGMPSEDQLRHMAQVMNEAVHKDPLLAKIERENKAPEDEAAGQQSIKQPISELKNEDIHIFTTFDEVLAFLKYEVQ